VDIGNSEFLAHGLPEFSNNQNSFRYIKAAIKNNKDEIESIDYAVV